MEDVSAHIRNFVLRTGNLVWLRYRSLEDNDKLGTQIREDEKCIQNFSVGKTLENFPISRQS
jgi:hypothetical protein